MAQLWVMKRNLSFPASLALGVAGAAAVAVFAQSYAADAPARGPAPTYASALEAFGDVCVTPTGQGGILAKARATRWRPLTGDAIPAMVMGNGMIGYKDVRQGQIAGAPVMLAVGELFGTSYCRVYFKPVDAAAMQEQLRAVTVLGSPLGASDFNGQLTFPEGWSAVGWHRSAGKQWRAVHYEFDADGQGPNAAWQAIEITREL